LTVGGLLDRGTPHAVLVPLVKSAHEYPMTAVRTKAHGGVERSFLVWRLVRWEMLVLTVQRNRCYHSW